MSNLNQLTDEKRLEAQERARQIVIKKNGDKPTREQFADVSVSEYPAWFTRIIAVIMVVVFIAAALPSLFRLYTAGYEYFTHGIDDGNMASIVGISTFLLAEFLIILSTISARVYFTGRQRWIFVIPIALGLSMALVGNWVIAQPYDLFGWLETLSPPIAVLFLALIGERLILDAIESRHANEKSYQVALSDWQVVISDPERSPLWQSAYANALKDALFETNSKGRGASKRTEYMQQMKLRQWSAYVAREMRAERWFDMDAELQDDIAETENTKVPVHTNGHDKTNAGDAVEVVTAPTGF